MYSTVKFVHVLVLLLASAFVWIAWHDPRAVGPITVGLCTIAAFAWLFNKK